MERDTPEFRKALWKVSRAACDAVRAAPPTSAMLRDWHGAAFASVVPLDYYAGNFRQMDRKRICLAQVSGVGGIPGSHWDDVRSHVSKLLEDVRKLLVRLDIRWSGLSNAERAKQLSTAVGLAVGRFIQIHPFLNGNGRVSRMLWRALFARFELPPQVAVLRRPTEPAYSRAMRAAMQGNFGPCVRLVLDALMTKPPSIPPSPG